MADGPPAIRNLTRRQCGWGRAWRLLPAVACLFLHVPLPAFGAASQLALRLVPAQVKQGGVTVLNIEGPVPIRALRVQVGDRELPAAPADSRTRVVLLIGVDLERPPGPVLVRVDAVEGRGRPLTGQRTLRVLDAHFPMQRLTVPRPFVDLDPATLERVGREKEALDRLWETIGPDRFWRGPFRLPLDGAGSASGFGERRIINGEPRAPHTGADFSAPAGAPVFAANAGVVVLAADHFFAGTSVILDHGLGLYTMYFHLLESLVHPDQRVDRGQVIARVGSTGRATGPHLHWGARLYGARIDPRELLKPLPLE